MHLPAFLRVMLTRATYRGHREYRYRLVPRLFSSRLTFNSTGSYFGRNSAVKISTPRICGKKVPLQNRTRIANIAFALVATDLTR